jgi:hypothetical protein
MFHKVDMNDAQSPISLNPHVNQWDISPRLFAKDTVITLGRDDREVDRHTNSVAGTR